MLIHPIEPVYDENSRVLILGSFPSVKSREVGFYYGHPQNRFWKVLASLFNQKIPESLQEKRAFLLLNKIALWDVIKSCDIKGSSDSSIKNVEANDIRPILNFSPITKIFVNGKSAAALYKKYILPYSKREAFCLPSTSPANAAWSLEKLCEAWKEILQSE